MYDLGASGGTLQKIYEDEAPSQRPIILDPKDESIVVSEENWIQYLGNQRCVRLKAVTIFVAIDYEDLEAHTVLLLNSLLINSKTLE